MNFSEFANLIKRYDKNSTNVHDFLCTLTDAIIDVDSSDEINPIYKLSESTCEAYLYNKRKISQDIAIYFNSMISKSNFISYIKELPTHDRKSIALQLKNYGFDVGYCHVAKVCADIFAQIIDQRAAGNPDDVTTLNEILPPKVKKRLNDIPKYDIKLDKNYIHITGGTVRVVKMDVPEQSAQHEAPYITAICKAFMDCLGGSVEVTEDRIPSLQEPLPTFFKKQREAYYSAVSIQRSLRDSYSDAESEFEIIEKDAFDGIYITYIDKYDNGYERLKAVLNKITVTTLDKSVLCQIHSLIGTLEKQGICHILVNDGVIKSWVTVDDR